jgi:hypothetical protein
MPKGPRGVSAAPQTRLEPPCWWAGLLLARPRTQSETQAPRQNGNADRRTIFGNVDHNKISTSHTERQNVNMRMGMRRFTRLTNASPRNSITTATRWRCTFSITIFAASTSRFASLPR